MKNSPAGTIKTLIIGLGNTILKDDGAGIRAAELVKNKIGHMDDIDFIELSVGGIRLMEAMAGYDRVFIIDAVMTGKLPGTICRLNLCDLGMSLHASSTHDASLACAIETGKKIGIKLPSKVVIWGIEAANVNDFGEDMTYEVERALPELTEKILQEL